MIGIKQLVDGAAVKGRRERLGMSQPELAKRVQELSGESFTQQSLSKFEKGGKTTKAVFILDALAKIEQERGLLNQGSVQEPPADYPSIRDSMGGLSDEQLRDSIRQISQEVSPRDALELALILLERARGGL